MVKKVFMLEIILFIVSCDARVGKRLKSTQAQLPLGREGKAPSAWRRRISSCRPSSPFSLSMRHRHVEGPTNNEAHKTSQATYAKPRAGGPLRTLPIFAMCGGAAIKVLYTSKGSGGRNRR